MQYTNLIWRDGQPYSELFDDIYYSSGGTEAIAGESEFNHVFFKHNNLAQRWHESDCFVIAELGFGSGLNCVLTIRQWLKHCVNSNTRKTLHYIAIEKHPLSAGSVAALVSRYAELKPICDEILKSYPPAVEATHCRSLFDNQVVIHYKFMDVEKALNDENLKVDAWYLDGFSPAKNPAMWSADVFNKVAVNSADAASCSTYTSAGFVKRNLQQAGFEVAKVKGYGEKREMLVASLKQKISPILYYKNNPWFVAAPTVGYEAKEITIIGAGVAGLAVAFSMMKRGWSVTIIDKHGEIAKQASSNPAAIVYPRLSVNNEVDTQFYVAAYCYSLYVLDLLQGELSTGKSSIAFWFDDGLQQSFDRKRITDILQHFQFNKDFMEVVEQENRKQTVLLDYKKAGVVLPQMLCEKIVQVCGSSLKIVRGQVDAISRHNNKWSCFSNNKLINESDCLVIANGESINELDDSFDFPVESIRGQAMVINANTASTAFKQTINADVYFTSAIAGQHYLGATYSRLNKNSYVDREENESLLTSLEKIYPDSFTLMDLKESWVGFRCMSKDRVPIVGALPDRDFFDEEYADIHHGKHHKPYPAACHQSGLYITAAHGSRGFTSSFLSAEIIAAEIAGEPSPVNKKTLNYLSPSRFIVNKLKRS